MKKEIITSSLITLCMPWVIFAQDLDGTQRLLNAVLRAGTLLIGIAIVLAFLFFVWGIAEFIRKADDASSREEGKKRMIWGVIALTVLATIWGIVRWIQGEFGLSGFDQSAPGIFQFFQTWQG